MATTLDPNTPIPRQTIVRDLYSSKFTNLQAGISVKWALKLMDVVLSIALYVAGALGREVDTMRARLDALEQRPILEYRGTWKQDSVYDTNTLITHGGSLWIAKSASVSKRPGGPDGVWQLCCKRGDDGRDGRDGTNCPRCGEANEATS